jgi:hypothetical protein
LEGEGRGEEGGGKGREGVGEGERERRGRKGEKGVVEKRVVKKEWRVLGEEGLERRVELVEGEERGGRGK